MPPCRDFDYDDFRLRWRVIRRAYRIWAGPDEREVEEEDIIIIKGTVDPTEK